MKTGKYIYFTTKEFILDEDFIQWALHPNPENDRQWKEFLYNHPEKKQQIDEACLIVRSIRAYEPSISSERLEHVFQKSRDAAKPERKIGKTVIKLAAVFLFLISLGGWLYYWMIKDTYFPVELAAGDLLEKGRVIMPDGTIAEFESEQTQIRQTVAGDLTINNDTLDIQHVPAQAEEQNLAQVIIPYGKRSEITLSDGTKIWLNSGSQLSYPVRFSGDLREVYLVGEAFFEVESDPSKPFHVITGDMKIKVTGTRFNVTSYANDQFTQAVLLSGKIDAARNKRFSRTVELQPGERIVYNKQEENMKTDHVNAELYTSWVKGYLVFKNEPVQNIFNQLERYYNRDIVTENFSGQPTFTGKLDLADDLEKVLKNIAFAASFSVDYKNDIFLIRQKK